MPENGYFWSFYPIFGKVGWSCLKPLVDKDNLRENKDKQDAMMKERTPFSSWGNLRGLGYLTAASSI